MTDDDDDFQVTLEEQNSTLYCAALDINKRMRKDAANVTSFFKKDNNCLQLERLNMEEALQHIDPHVWNFICIMTMNTEEARMFDPGALNWDDHLRIENGSTSCSEAHVSMKMTRRLMLIFTTHFLFNNNNLHPFHLINTDLIKRYSNSSKLVQICNKLGFCASEKALTQYLKKVDSCQDKMPSLKNGSFTVASFDNLDALFVHGAISADGKGRSWHGTTVMASQPLPNTELLGYGEVLSKDTSNDTSNLHCIKVFGDGWCFYRCIASFIRPELISCDRTIWGLPLDESLLDLETTFADKICHSVCEFLQNSLEALQSLPPDMQKQILETKSGHHDPDFTTRIMSNRNTGTYAGMLEVTATAYLMKLPIQLYHIRNSTYEIVTAYPSSLFDANKPVMLVYESDIGKPGHFDLLVQKDCLHSTSKVVESISFDTWLASQTHSLFANVKFIDCLHDSVISLKPSSSDMLTEERLKTVSRVLLADTDDTLDKCFTGSPIYKTFLQYQVSSDQFATSPVEEFQTSCLKVDLFMYALERYHILKRNISVSMPMLKCKIALEQPPHCEKSVYDYIRVYNEPADSLATVQQVLGDLHKTFKIGVELNHLVLVGDLKSYAYIMKLKLQYGGNLDWVIPYPGDWHILKNFQEVLMKVFWEAGLKDLAKLRHHQMTYQKLQTCSNFKRTHKFFLQTYEAIYMYFIDVFLKDRDNTDAAGNCSFTTAQISLVVSSVVTNLEQCAEKDYTNVSDFLDAQKKMQTNLIPSLISEFNSWCSKMCKNNKTFAFWCQFLDVDMLAYIQLFLSIRSRNWTMRMAAVKTIAKLFHAFDRYNYAKWLPVHLSHMFALPSYILNHFKSGGFACSLKGTNLASIGLDETHETTINKDVKAVIQRNTPKHIDVMVSTLRFEARMLSNLFEQVSLKRKNRLHRDFSPSVILNEQNLVSAYCSKLESSTIFSEIGKSYLHKAFSEVQAEKAVEDDLTTYFVEGEKLYINYVNACILQKDTAERTVLRRRQLRTFATKKVTKTKVKQMEKEKKLVLLCHNRVFNAMKKGISIMSTTQYIEEPRAICMVGGIPTKGIKSTIYSILQTRYKTLQIIVHRMPVASSKCLIAEGMNMIHRAPIGLKTFDYTADYTADSELIYANPWSSSKQQNELDDDFYLV